MAKTSLILIVTFFLAQTLNSTEIYGVPKIIDGDSVHIKNVFTNYLFILFVSCVLEIFHLIVPNRAFELYDLIANFTGVVIILLLNSFIKWRKHL